VDRPLRSDFAGWRQSSMTQWYFNYLDEYVKNLAVEACEYAGTDMKENALAKQAGFILGLREAMEHDPFLEEVNETESDWPKDIG